MSAEYVGTACGTQLARGAAGAQLTWTRKSENPRLKEGMVLAIEPMVNAGRPEVEMVLTGPLDYAVTVDG